MPRFKAKRRVRHSANDMFALVVDMERYPEFVPLCKDMRVRGLTEIDEGVTVATARMTVAYRMIREIFTTKVTMHEPELWITVEYLDGPLHVLSNRWSFRPISEAASEVEFYIDYEFKSRILSVVMGAVFDAAFRRFASAFEKRADQVYGNNGSRAIASS
ncbi:MAG: SRPBCC family protein [Rhodoplanes sp.]